MISNSAANVIVSDDFNDGTTKNWWDNDTLSNENNQLRFGNSTGSGTPATQVGK